MIRTTSKHARRCVGIHRGQHHGARGPGRAGGLDAEHDPGITALSREIYGLHMLMFWWCVGIAIVVFGFMIYSMVRFRKSKGAVADTRLLHSTRVEIIWTIVPVLILISMAVPAARVLVQTEDPVGTAAHDPRHRLSVEVGL